MRGDPQVLDFLAGSHGVRPFGIRWEERQGEFTRDLFHRTGGGVCARGRLMGVHSGLRTIRTARRGVVPQGSAPRHPGSDRRERLSCSRY